MPRVAIMKLLSGFTLRQDPVVRDAAQFMRDAAQSCITEERGALYSPDLLKERLVGRTLTYYNVVGEAEQVTVDEKMIGKPSLSSYTIQEEGKAKKIQAWVVPISRGMWVAYFHSQTGQELEIRQNFLTFSW